MEDTAEPIIKLECNLDDMSSEQIAFAAEVLFEHGARDVYTIPITMKKIQTWNYFECYLRARKKKRDGLIDF